MNANCCVVAAVPFCYVELSRDICCCLNELGDGRSNSERFLDSLGMKKKCAAGGARAQGRKSVVVARSQLWRLLVPREKIGFLDIYRDSWGHDGDLFCCGLQRPDS